MLNGGVLFACAVLAAGAATASQPARPADAAAIIALTRETRASYSLYLWNVVTLRGAPELREWSAEFHMGPLHRVETPRDRIVADCAAMTGTHLDLRSGERTSGAHVARAACGIHANSRILSAAVVGTSDSDRFGPVVHLEIVDPGAVRTYAVAANGALVAATISDHSGHRDLAAEAVRLENEVRADIFSSESLDDSAVPGRFRQAPPASANP